MKPHPARLCFGLAATCSFLALACSGGKAGGGGGGNDADSGAPVTTTPSAGEQAERAQVASALAEVQSLDRAGLRSRFPSSFASGLSYDPLTAANLARIQSSPLGLTDAERQVLAKDGFVISDRKRFPGFTYGYDSIYANDLPVFVSADSILNAVHRSYDSLLQDLEVASLRPTLRPGRAELSCGAARFRHTET